MPFFIKKPITVEARLFDGTHGSAVEIFEWAGGKYTFFKDSLCPIQIHIPPRGKSLDSSEWSLEVTTPEGKFAVRAGYWIIKGVAHEFYACRADIFVQTYDEVK